MAYVAPTIHTSSRRRSQTSSFCPPASPPASHPLPLALVYRSASPGSLDAHPGSDWAKMGRRRRCSACVAPSSPIEAHPKHGLVAEREDMPAGLSRRAASSHEGEARCPFPVRAQERREPSTFGLEREGVSLGTCVEKERGNMIASLELSVSSEQLRSWDDGHLVTQLRIWEKQHPIIFYRTSDHQKPLPARISVSAAVGTFSRRRSYVVVSTSSRTIS